MRRFGLAVVIGLAAGSACFTDSEPAANGCPPGGPGCACRPDETCDAGLECLDPGVCVEQSCTPGTRSCVCDEGSCVGDLVCNELGACVERMSTDTDVATTAASASGDGTSTTATSTSTSSGSTTAGGSSTGPSETTGSNNACSMCMQQGAGPACYDEYPCGQTCLNALECLVECQMQGQGPDACGTRCCGPIDFVTQAYFACVVAACPDCAFPASCLPMDGG